MSYSDFEFIPKIAEQPVREGELWGIFHGLSIASEKGFKKVVVECDSSQAVQLLNDGQAASDNLALVRKYSRTVRTLCCSKCSTVRYIRIAWSSVEGTFDSVGTTKLQDAGKAGLVMTIQGKNSAVLGSALILEQAHINFVPRSSGEAASDESCEAAPASSSRLALEAPTTTPSRHSFSAPQEISFVGFESYPEDIFNEERVYLNTDGAVSLDFGLGANGGVIRDKAENWITGFHSYLGKVSVLDAELWGILNGLKLIRQRGYDHVIISSDCLEVIKAINGRSSTSPNSTLIRCIHNILSQEKQWSLRYIPRDHN
ncbi:hypothetical protein J1N35_033398 [Gossypium stocksii]|uniref:RNase H type-1 domain-containing protein n=1 Tax=Gossypium stocksii TaxID=47602 RepID=A0A9D3UQ88_9ROSI|nr:hypothetical protein J1N35_033398 [Gossypium stocksii]